MSLLIKNVLLNGKETSIYVEGDTIKSIGKEENANEVMDGMGKIALPGFINTHNHAAMTLFRGYADDLKLHDWLENHIWPLEAKLTEEDVYWGTKLACLEMIKSGTTCFADNYLHIMGSAKAADEMGLRTVVAEVYMDFFDTDRAEKEKKKQETVIKKIKDMKNERIKPSLAPHAPYTVSAESLAWVAEYAKEDALPIQLHLAETEKECADFYVKNNKRIVPFLEDIGFLGSNVIAAHSVWLEKGDIEILARHDVKISHNPVSNMKLASGILPYREMKAAGLSISLGTDGCASNNDLDMFESMKFASLLQKVHLYDPTALPAKEAYEMATLNGAKALGINAGAIKEDMFADIILINRNRPELTPGKNLAADLVYSAKGSCVDTVICGGKVLMEHGRMEGEEYIMAKAREVAEDLYGR